MVYCDFYERKLQPSMSPCTCRAVPVSPWGTGHCWEGEESVASGSLSPANKSQLSVAPSKGALIAAAFCFDVPDVEGPNSGRRGGFFFLRIIGRQGLEG